MKRIYWIIVAAFLLFPASPAAANWSRSPTGTANDCSFSSGARVCYHNITDTSDSAILVTALCETVDVLFNSDTLAETTDSTIQVRNCQGTTASVNECWITENVTLDGDPSLNTEGIYGMAGVSIYVDSIVYGATDAPRVAALCHPVR